MFPVKGLKQNLNMAFPMVILRIAEWIFFKIWAKSLYRAATKVRNNSTTFFRKNPSLSLRSSSQFIPSVTKCNLHGRETQTVVCGDINGTLLRSQSSFPFFMLIAFEGGGIFRAFLLLLSYPVLLLLVFNNQLKLRVMIFITFCGLKIKNMETVSRAVLPKFYLENLNVHVYDVLASAGSRLVFTILPKIMVEGFLKDYLNFDTVRGTELHTVGNYYTGFISSSGLLVKHRDLKDFSGENMPDIGIGSSSSLHDHLLISLCKEAYVVVNKVDDTSERSRMPRDKYPKPLVFHDGRLAFLPTPLATLAMFIWLPLGILLAFFRLTIGIFFPYELAIFIGSATGAEIRVEQLEENMIISSSKSQKNKNGVLYVCSHRTLLDPVILSTALGKPLTAVTYSLSKMSEFLSPIRTVRLTRNRKQDGETMQRLLAEGDLVVCPEGTTCREPYLLRFSSLFAELADEIVPVAINTKVTMFYGTTASGLKCLDPIFFLMNPRPNYSIKILGKVPKEYTIAGGKSSHEVANYIQREIGNALGFECTTFTRRDKYLMLAGNEGFVQESNNNNNNSNNTNK